MTTPTKDHVELRSGAYADSVTLLQVSRAVQAAPGVVTAQVAMATGLNLEVLEGMGFDVPGVLPQRHGRRAAPRRRRRRVRTALAAVDAALAPTRPTAGDTTVAAAAHDGVRAATRGGPGAIALVSVPGASATVEAMDALEAGHDVMVFSDNVPGGRGGRAQDVRRLARRAGDGARLRHRGHRRRRARLRQRRPSRTDRHRRRLRHRLPAAARACSTTPAQTAEGVGVRHALGVGGRDLSSAVGGLSTREALRRLDADPEVDLVVVVSKPPAAEVARDLAAYVETLATPVELGLLGPRPARPDRRRRGGAGAARSHARRVAGRAAPTTPARRPAPCSAGSSSAARSATSRC